MIMRYIEVKTRFEGVHKYPEAHHLPELQDVKFLGYPHRHIFHIELHLSISHNNRDIEFIQCKRWLESLFKKDVIQLDFKSCEMIGEDIIKEAQKKYPTVDLIKVKVLEDGENGAITLWYKDETDD